MRRCLAILLLLVLAAAPVGTARAAGQSYPAVRLGGPSQDPASDATFAGISAGLPGWLRWALAPQLQSGGVSGAAGLTDRSYRALAWTVPLATGLLSQNDRLSFGFSLGDGFGSALLGADARDPRSMPPTPTTRLGAAIGYQVTPDLGLYVMFDHVSVNGLAREDEIANDLGMRLGLRF
jgi:hypothetical protein